MKDFAGKTYLYKGKIIGVVQGLGEEQYIAAYFSDNGGRHRVRNYAELPVCKTAEAAQQYLDRFAAARGLGEVVLNRRDENAGDFQGNAKDKR